MRPPALAAPIDDAAADRNIFLVQRAQKALAAFVVKLLHLGEIIMIRAGLKRRPFGNLQRHMTLQDQRRANEFCRTREFHYAAILTRASINRLLNRHRIQRRPIALSAIFLHSTYALAKIDSRHPFS